MPRKHRRPSCMNLKLRSRAEIAAWLLDVPGSSSHGYLQHEKGDHWLFAFPTNEAYADLSFEHLLEIHIKEQVTGNNDPDWIRGCKLKWLTEYHGEDEDILLSTPEADWPELELTDPAASLWSNAREDAARYFIGNRQDGKPEDDAWNTVWDGTPVKVEYRFGGYMDDYMVLKSFEGYTCAELPDRYENYHKDLVHKLRLDTGVNKPEDEDDTPIPWPTLKRLYEYVRFLSHWFAEDNYRKEIEYQVAWSFFNNLCDDVPNPTLDAAYRQRHRQQCQEQTLAFLDGLQRGRRITRGQTELFTGRTLLERPRRRVVSVHTIK